eukprot:99472_1
MAYPNQNQNQSSMSFAQGGGSYARLKMKVKPIKMKVKPIIHPSKPMTKTPPKQCRKRKQQTSIQSMAKDIPSSTEFEPPNKKRRLSSNYVCTQCDKSFKRVGNYRTHLLIHRNEKPFECALCSKRFRRKQHRDTHIDAVHKKNKKWKCGCGKSFAQKSNRTSHIKNGHCLSTGHGLIVSDGCTIPADGTDFVTVTGGMFSGYDESGSNLIKNKTGNKCEYDHEILQPTSNAIDTPQTKHGVQAQQNHQEWESIVKAKADKISFDSLRLIPLQNHNNNAGLPPLQPPNTNNNSKNNTHRPPNRIKMPPTPGYLKFNDLELEELKMCRELCQKLLEAKLFQVEHMASRAQLTRELFVSWVTGIGGANPTVINDLNQASMGTLPSLDPQQHLSMKCIRLLLIEIRKELETISNETATYDVDTNNKVRSLLREFDIASQCYEQKMIDFKRIQHDRLLEGCRLEDAYDPDTLHDKPLTRDEEKDVCDEEKDVCDEEKDVCDEEKQRQQLLFRLKGLSLSNLKQLLLRNEGDDYSGECFCVGGGMCTVCAIWLE